MPISLTKPAEGETGWATPVNTNFTDIETAVNALQARAINTSSPLTGGGDLTADRTISISNQSANTVLAGPTSGGAAAPTFRSFDGLIDSAIGSTRGALLMRGASAWSLLAPGTSGHVLKSNGSGADPSYQAAASGGNVLIGSATGTSATLTVTVPANTLAANGDALVILAATQGAGTSPTLTPVIRLGGSGGTALVTLTSHQASWIVLVVVIRTGSSAQAVMAFACTNAGGTVSVVQVVNGTAARDLTASQDVYLDVDDGGDPPSGADATRLVVFKVVA